MGSEESKPSRERVYVSTPPPRNQFSEVEVAELLERQKQHFDKKVEQIIKSQKESQPAQTIRSPSAATPRAGSSTTQVRNPSAIPPLRPPHSATPQAGPSTTQARNPAVISPLTVERNRSPYSFTQSQLNNQAAGPQALYPNLNHLQQQSQSNPRPSTSDFVFVNRKGNADRCVPVPSAPPAPQAPRDRSSSRPRYRKEDDQNEVKCPTCKKTYGLTIFQCPSGHSSCSDCKKANRVCGTCYKPIGNMRNIMLEELVSEMKMKCPYSEDGCNLFIKTADLENHAKECPFRELSCPMSSIMGCSWKGRLSQLEGHFENFHPMSRQGAVDTEMTLLNPKNNCLIAHLVVIGTYNFLFYLTVNHTAGKLYMAVQLIGTNMSASRWTYDVHIYNKGEPRRKFQHVDVCTANNTSIWDLISEDKCAVLPLSYASTFVCDNKLNYKFYIKKNENERPFGNNRGRGRGRGGHNKVGRQTNIAV